MNEHKYLTHLIKFQASKTTGAEYWIGKAEVHYNDGKGLRLFEVQGPSETFVSRTEAEQYIVQTAKKLIDSYI
jgi:hypothetical protein